MIIILVVILFNAVHVYAYEKNALMNELMGIAEKYLSTKNQLLVRGHSNIDLTNCLASSLIKRSNLYCTEEILSRRKLLIDKGDNYSSFQTQLLVKEKTIYKSTAIILVSEHTALKLNKANKDPLAPKTTEYVLEHRFIFVCYKNKNWKLFSDKLINEPAPTIPNFEAETFEIEIESTLLDESYNSGVKTLVVPVDLQTSEYNSQTTVATNWQWLDKTAVVNYAYKYWENYNNSYRKFSKDCTNFVSQAVYAGGWNHVSGFYRSSSAWWYNWGNQSWTWAGAHNWALFTYNRPRGFIAQYFSQMNPGDILQVDFDKDGHIDHSMIVTKKDSSNTIYLTYHTNNTKDRSISDLLSEYPNANYYGWRLYYGFK